MQNLTRKKMVVFCYNHVNVYMYELSVLCLARRDTAIFYPTFNMGSKDVKDRSSKPTFLLYPHPPFVEGGANCFAHVSWIFILPFRRRGKLLCPC